MTRQTKINTLVGVAVFGVCCAAVLLLRPRTSTSPPTEPTTVKPRSSISSPTPLTSQQVARSTLHPLPSSAANAASHLPSSATSTDWQYLVNHVHQGRRLADFLQELDDNQLIDFLRYCAELDVEHAVGVVFSQEMHRRWGDAIPYAHLLSYCASTQEPDFLRIVLLDFISATAKKGGSAQRAEVVSSLLPVTQDANESGEFRRQIILKLSSLIEQGITDLDRPRSVFNQLFADATESSLIRGASIAALRRCNDHAIVPALAQMCQDYSVDDDSVLMRSVVVNLAKCPRDDAAVSSVSTDILSIAAQTGDDRLYGSALYALSLVTSDEFHEVLPALLETLGPDPSPLRRQSFLGAVRNQHATISRALLASDRKAAEAALEICARFPVPHTDAAIRELDGRGSYDSQLVDAALANSQSASPTKFKGEE